VPFHWTGVSSSFALGLSVIASVVGFGVSQRSRHRRRNSQCSQAGHADNLTAGSAQSRGRRLLVAGELALIDDFPAGPASCCEVSRNWRRVDWLRRRVS
jgi:hypothetical protein